MFELGGLAMNEGRNVGYYRSKSAEECKILCIESEKCKSVSHDAVYFHCYLKNKIFGGTEPKKGGRYSTYYKICEGTFHIKQIKINF